MMCPVHLFYLTFMVLFTSSHGIYIAKSLPICQVTRNRELFVSLPNEGCKRFIFCSRHGRAFGPLYCPGTTQFNFQRQLCDFPHNFQCDDGQPSCENRPIRGDCNKFVICDRYLKEVPLVCGNGLVFSKHLGVCIRFGDLSEEEKEYCRSV